MEISGIELNELEFDSIGSWPLLIRTIVMSLVFVVTIIAGYLFDLSDAWDAMSTVQQQRIDLEKTFENAQHKVANLDAYKEQVRLVENELQKLTQQLPQNNEEAGLLEDISKEASLSGLQFVSIIPGKEQTKEFYVENPIELTLSGSYNGLGEFVSTISNMQRIVTFHEFSITRSPQKTQTENVKGVFIAEEMKGPLMMKVMTKTYWTVPNKGTNK